MTRTQLEKKIEKLKGTITTKADKRQQLQQQLDQHKAELKAAQAELKALPKGKAKATTTAGGESEE